VHDFVKTSLRVHHYKTKWKNTGRHIKIFINLTIFGAAFGIGVALPLLSAGLNTRNVNSRSYFIVYSSDCQTAAQETLVSNTNTSFQKKITI